MAKKKEEEFKYGSVPLTQDEKQYTIRRNSFAGLDYKTTLNSNRLSYCKNISTTDAPVMAPSNDWGVWGQIKHIPTKTDTEPTTPEKVLSVQTIDKYVYVFYTIIDKVTDQPDITRLYCKVIPYDANKDDIEATTSSLEGGTYIILINEDLTETTTTSGTTTTTVLNRIDATSPRYIAAFNRYSDVEDINNGRFSRTLIVVPDMKIIEYDIVVLSNATNYKWVSTETEGYFVETSEPTGAEHEGVYEFPSFAAVIGTLNDFSATEQAKFNLDAFYRFNRWNGYKGSGFTRTYHYKVTKNGTTFSAEEVTESDTTYSKTETPYFRAYDMSVVMKTYRTKTDSSGNVVDGTYTKTKDIKYNPLKTYYTLTATRADSTTKKTYTLVDYPVIYVIDDNASESGAKVRASNVYYKNTTTSEDGTAGEWDGLWVKASVAEGDILISSVYGGIYKMSSTTVSSGDTSSNTYTAVADNTYTAGQDITDKELYEFSGYLPPSDSDKTQYWYNEANGYVYAYFEGKDDYGNVMGWQQTATPSVPQMDLATIYQSRLCGIKGGKVYISGASEPGDWYFDQGDEHDDDSPWACDTNQDTGYTGDIKGIIPYDGNVIIFKDDSIQAITGTKNPFTRSNIFTEGCVSQDTLQILNGTLIFLSKNGVMAYTGYKPKRIGDRLAISRFDGERYASCNDARTYYLYYETATNKRLFTYDTWNDAWCEENVPGSVVSMAYNNKQNGVIMLCEIPTSTENVYDYKLYRRSTDHKVNWACETDIISTVSSSSSTYATYNVKRIKHLQIAYTVVDEGVDCSCKVYLLKNHEAFDEDESIELCDLDCEAGFHVEDKVIRGGAVRDFRLRFEGYGNVRIEGIQLSMAYGGEVTNE